MINKITLIVISEKVTRSANPSFRKNFLSTGILFFLMFLFSSQIYSQTTQNITIPSGSLKVNMGVRPNTYVYNDRAYLITTAACKIEQLGGRLTLAHFNHMYHNYI